ncbi:MAG TPA: site-specific integrase [Gaiellaceae bacterium]|nr:site-specific integrase [Gaiellaceae bacterium]
MQQGQVFELKRTGRDGEPQWAYRYRTGGRASRRIQRGGFASEQDAIEALERELDRVRREQRIPRSLTFAELVDVYLAQHDVQPVTIEKLRWLLSKAIAVFGERRIGELTSQEIAEWRMNLSPGYRFEATQAVRQVLNRAVVWEMLDINAAKVGVDNPTPRRKEQHPFESWDELEQVAAALGPRYGPMILFAAATGLRPAEWVALEKRDIDRAGQVAFVRRSYTRAELKLPKTEGSLRAVPLQGRALDAFDRLPKNESPLVFPGERGGYLDMHHFRPYQWRPAQKAVGIAPLRRVYDLRHTFATFALRAGISTFDLSRYMGASLTMIDRHYGHLARDGREHAIKLLDALNASESEPSTEVDGPRLETTIGATRRSGGGTSRLKQEASRS